MTERLQKIISGAGVASRRKAEELLSAGRVTVNGIRASLGQSADAETDEIRVDGVLLRSGADRTYIMLNKPRGYVTTLSDEKGRKTVAELAPPGKRLYPVGRLDMYSEGLLIMTDDGEAANVLMHPSHDVKKLYQAWVTGEDIAASVKTLRQIREVEGRAVRPAEVSVVTRDGEQALIEIGIFEGRNRQVRRMCEAAGLKVTRLLRTAEGELRLGELPSGKWRRLNSAEVQYLKNIR